MDKKDMKQDKAVVKKAVGMHDKQQHGGKKTNLSMLKKGGATHKMPDGSMMAGKKHGMKHGGMAKGGKTNDEMKSMGRNMAKMKANGK